MKEKHVKLILLSFLTFFLLLGTLVYRLSSNVSLDRWTIVSLKKSQFCLIYNQKFEVIKNNEKQISYKEKKYKVFRTLEVISGHINRKYRELSIKDIIAVYKEGRNETTVQYDLTGDYYLEDSLVRKPNVMAQKDCQNWLKKIKKQVQLNY